MLGALSQLFRGTPQEVASRFAAAGLDCVQILPQFEGVRFDSASDVLRNRCREISKPFRDANIAIVGVTANLNLVDPDMHRRRRQAALFDALLENVRDLGARSLIVESGSINASRPWEDFPENHSPEALQLFVKQLKPHVRRAEKCGAMILIEPHLHHIVSDVERALAVRKELGEYVGFVMDPPNLFTRAMASASQKPLRALFASLGAISPVAHGKDVRYVGHELTTPRAGTGTLDYAEFLRQWGEYQPGGPLVLEQITAAQLEETVDFLERFFRRD
jgi:sugar phosphate isomerase/epimerase